MGNMENLRALEEAYLDPDGGDWRCAGSMDCIMECDFCGDLEDEKETIEFCGKRICFHCVEGILEEYGG